MSTSNITFRLIVILSVLTVFNMMFLGFSWTKTDQGRMCTVDNVIDSVSKFINDNGRLTLDQKLSESCRKSEPRGITKEALLSTILNVIDVCRKTKKRVFPKTLTSPIITLFTTWPNGTNQEKRSIHNITLRNWIRFKPKVDVLVFVNDTESVDFAKSLGITTLPILHSAAGGAPVLKTMFKTVQKLQPSSHLYGYVNSDIIFTNKLLETLELLLQSRINTSEPILMVGKRVNVFNVSYKESSTDIDIEQIAKARGTLFNANAEDYFFTNSAYPWKDIAEVVVGRLAYDNWLVAHTLCNLNIDLIELTDSVLAVHQTTDSGGVYEGFRHEQAHYNNLLFKQLAIVPKFESGFTICAKEYTYIDLCGHIEITNRTDFWHECACPNKTAPVQNTQ